MREQILETSFVNFSSSPQIRSCSAGDEQRLEHAPRILEYRRHDAAGTRDVDGAIATVNAPGDGAIKHPVDDAARFTLQAQRRGRPGRRLSLCVGGLQQRQVVLQPIVSGQAAGDQLGQQYPAFTDLLDDGDFGGGHRLPRCTLQEVLRKEKEMAGPRFEDDSLPVRAAVFASGSTALMSTVSVSTPDHLRGPTLASVVPAGVFQE